MSPGSGAAEEPLALGPKCFWPCREGMAPVTEKKNRKQQQIRVFFYVGFLN